MTPWTCLILGCGTVGYWTAQTLLNLQSPVTSALTRWILCDKAVVRPHNAITCPDFATYLGRYKCHALAELLRPGLESTPVLTLPARVEELDWSAVLPEAEHQVLVVMGLDDWQARLCVVEDVRLRADATARPYDVVLVQVGLDRNHAQVCVFGDRFSDPCPACDLMTLPRSEPCVAFSADADLLRGDLRHEARAAADHVCRIVTDVLHGSNRWRNTKTNLALGTREVLVRPSRRRDGCLGPHSRATPIRWDSILPRLALGGLNS